MFVLTGTERAGLLVLQGAVHLEHTVLALVIRSDQVDLQLK